MPELSGLRCGWSHQCCLPHITVGMVCKPLPYLTSDFTNAHARQWISGPSCVCVRWLSFECQGRACSTCRQIWPEANQNRSHQEQTVNSCCKHCPLVVQRHELWQNEGNCSNQWSRTRARCSHQAIRSMTSL